ncbi:hypothetical protein ACWD4F_34855 [Streptomyces aureus]
MFKRLVTAAVTAVLIAGLGACGQSGDTHDEVSNHALDAGQDDGSTAGQPATTATEDPSVVGVRDQVRHRAAQTTLATRPRMTKKCTTTTHRVKHTTTTGSGTKRRSRSWYSTDHSTSCEKVRAGTQTYRRVVRPERWCVRLDDVGGDPKKDDVWFQVTPTTYHSAVGADERAHLEFAPTGNGC